MSTTTFDTRTTTTTATTGTADDKAAKHAGRVTWKRGLATGVAAAAASTVVATVFHVAGHALSVVDQDGKAGAIPLFAFAQMVLIGTLIGIVVARHTSRAAFVRATVVLTALSCVPSIAWGETVTDKVGLVVTHLVAAAVVIPRIAPR